MAIIFHFEAELALAKVKDNRKGEVFTGDAHILVPLVDSVGFKTQISAQDIGPYRENIRSSRYVRIHDTDYKS